MVLKIGTLTIADLLENKQTTVAEVDERELAAILQRELDAHNALTDDMVTPLAEPTEDRQRQAGTGESGEMIEADEFARVPTQKTDLGANLGFPLKKYDFAVGLTREWMEMATLADFAKKAQFAQIADIQRLLREAKKALFLTTNYAIADRFETPTLSLDVKRLANADGFAIPLGPNGEVFDAATHSHYLGSATLTPAAGISLVSTVQEHFSGAAVNVAINQADETGWRGLTGFKEFVEPGVQLGTGQVATQRLDMNNTGNRAIGRFNGATVWIKPWGIDDYALAYVVSGAPKALAYRQPKGPRKGLRNLAELNTHPLHTQYVGRKFGFGVQNRVAAAVLYHANATYANPTI